MMQTAERFFQETDPIAFAMQQAARQKAPLDIPRSRVLPDGEAYAEVNHGRWIVRCPACPGAQMAFEHDQRFFCADCGAGPMRVVWPDDRAAIEAALHARSSRMNMNWTRDETVQDLHDENRAHGVGR